MKKLTEKAIWEDRDRLDLALKGKCPVIRRPPYTEITGCLGKDVCLIYDKCKNNRNVLRTAAKAYYLTTLDGILGLER